MKNNISLKGRLNNASLASPAGPRTEKNRRKRMNKKLKQQELPVMNVGSMSTYSGRAAMAPKTSRGLNRALRGLDLNEPGQVKDPFAQVNKMSYAKTAALARNEENFVMLHLDPCGEYETNVLDGRIPDGALPQSSALELRELFTVKVPGSSSTEVSLDGKMWNLTLFHWPLLRMPLVMIATLDKAEPTRIDVENCYAYLSGVANIDTLDYPNWTQIGAAQVYLSVVRWTALRTLPPPTAETQWIKQYRITADGMTVFDNTPDLINQGVVVGAQFNADYKFEATGEDFHTIAASVVANVQPAAGSSRTVVVHWPLPLADGSNTTTVVVGSIGAAPTTVSVDFTLAERFDFHGGATGSPGLPYLCTVTIQRSVGQLPVNDNVLVQLGTADSPQLLAWGRWATLGLTSTGGTTWTADVFTGVNDHQLVQIPSHGMQSLVQETAKTVSFTMKEDNGFYMVKRVWEPVFNMTEMKDYGQLIFDTPSVGGATLVAGGWSDSFDRNYGVGVTNISSLPYACMPMIKLYRVVEIVAGQHSPYGPFMSACPDRNELVQCVIRDIADKSPFMYPESYNVFDKLFGALTGVLGNLPKVFANVPVIGDIINGVLGSVSSNSKKKGDKNKLVSLSNPDTLEKVVAELISQLTGR